MREALLVAGGVLNCALIAFHVSFWRFRRLNWRVELQFVFFRTTAFGLVFVGVCVVTAACYFAAMV